MFFKDADAILHMLLVLALDILRLHGRLGRWGEGGDGGDGGEGHLGMTI